MYKKILIYLGFTVLATALWWVHALTSVRDNTIKLPIDYIGLSENVTMDHELPATLRIVVRDKGHNLLEFIHSHPTVKIDIDSRMKTDEGNVDISKDELESQVTKILPPTSELLRIKPESISFTYSERYTEKVFTLPIEVRGANSAQQVRLFPAQVEVTLRISIDHYQDLSEQDVTAYIEMPRQASDQLPIKIKCKNKHVTHFRFKPETVEYLVEQ
ncbi:MAG: hypothetical protein MJZ82_00845 [Paludibacteraceae bacterium]|nr:hypothetical protein [Paludibacteraceae bacterium]